MFERALKIGDLANIPVTVVTYLGAGMYAWNWLADHKVGATWQLMLILVVVVVAVSSVALQIVGLLQPTWRWRSSTAVESPLEWHNGVLRWKEGRLKQVANGQFKNQEVRLDGIEYIDCVFDGVTFVYDGTAKTAISGGIIKATPDDKPNARFRTGNLIVGTAALVFQGIGFFREDAKRRIESAPLALQ